jgi:hypothetical protein
MKGESGGSGWGAITATRKRNQQEGTPKNKDVAGTAIKRKGTVIHR